jgi:hypothetical protein
VAARFPVEREDVELAVEGMERGHLLLAEAVLAPGRRIIVRVEDVLDPVPARAARAVDPVAAARSIRVVDAVSERLDDVELVVRPADPRTQKGAKWRPRARQLDLGGEQVPPGRPRGLLV